MTCTSGTARSCFMTSLVAESPIRNAASTSPAARSRAASSPAAGDRVTVFSMWLASSNVSASARVPLPSGPMARRFPLRSVNRSASSGKRSKTSSGSGNIVPSDTSPERSTPSWRPPWTNPTSMSDLRSTSRFRFSKKPCDVTISTFTPWLFDVLLVLLGVEVKVAARRPLISRMAPGGAGRINFTANMTAAAITIPSGTITVRKSRDVAARRLKPDFIRMAAVFYKEPARPRRATSDPFRPICKRRCPRLSRRRADMYAARTPLVYLWPYLCRVWLFVFRT